jgi:hypothetical protein
MTVPTLPRKRYIELPETREGVRLHIMAEHGRSCVNIGLSFEALKQAHRKMHQHETQTHTHEKG